MKLKFSKKTIFEAVEKYRTTRKIKYVELSEAELQEDDFIPPPRPTDHPDKWDSCLCEFVPGKPVVPIPVGSAEWNRVMEEKYTVEEYIKSVDHYLAVDGRQEFYYSFKSISDASNLLYRDSMDPGKFCVAMECKVERRENMRIYTILYTLLFLDANGRIKTRNIVFGKIKNRRRYSIYGLKTWHISVTALIRHLVENQIELEGTPLTHTFRKLV